MDIWPVYTPRTDLGRGEGHFPGIHILVSKTKFKGILSTRSEHAQYCAFGSPVVVESTRQMMGSWERPASVNVVVMKESLIRLERY